LTPFLKASPAHQGIARPFTRRVMPHPLTRIASEANCSFDAIKNLSVTMLAHGNADSTL
jgi:hypothetical protein